MTRKGIYIDLDAACDGYCYDCFGGCSYRKNSALHVATLPPPPRKTTTDATLLHDRQRGLLCVWPYVVPCFRDINVHLKSAFLLSIRPISALQCAFLHYTRIQEKKKN